MNERETTERAESAAAAHRVREAKRRHDQERRIVELSVMVEVPEDWSDDGAADEAFTILELSEEEGLNVVSVTALERALRWPLLSKYGA